MVYATSKLRPLVVHKIGESSEWIGLAAEVRHHEVADHRRPGRRARGAPPALRRLGCLGRRRAATEASEDDDVEGEHVERVLVARNSARIVALCSWWTGKTTYSAELDARRDLAFVLNYAEIMRRIASAGSTPLEEAMIMNSD